MVGLYVHAWTSQACDIVSDMQDAARVTVIWLIRLLVLPFQLSHLTACSSTYPARQQLCPGRDDTSYGYMHGSLRISKHHQQRAHPDRFRSVRFGRPMMADYTLHHPSTDGRLLDRFFIPIRHCGVISQNCSYTARCCKYTQHTLNES